MTKIDIIREYRTTYPNMPNKALARLIYQKESILFNSIENIRKAILHIEGKGVGKGVKVTHKSPPRPYNPYVLPDSHKEDREPFRLPAACNNILLLSDLHIPYHDIDAITIALDYGKQNKVNTIFINGDLIDFHGCSKFEKDPRKRSIKQEFDATKQFIRSLRKAFPKAEIYWLKGNHDVRYERWLMAKVVEIFDDEYYHLEQRLSLNDERVKLLDDKCLVKAGKLSITHGHHIFKGVFSPVNPSRGAFLRAKQSIIVGHLHRASHHPEVTADGEIISCWSTACLCELKPDYSPLVSNSQHGFAHVTIEKNGDYTVKNYQIIKGKLH